MNDVKNMFFRTVLIKLNNVFTKYFDMEISVVGHELYQKLITCTYTVIQYSKRNRQRILNLLSLVMVHTVHVFIYYTTV